MNWKRLTALGLVGVLALGSISGCLSGGGGIEAIEEMSDLEYSKWQLYISLGVKIGAGRLLDTEAISAEELELAADVLEGVATNPVTVGATSLIQPALVEAGLTGDEIQLLLLIVEQELLARGGLDGIVNPDSGLIELTPRTKELLELVASSLRGATAVSESEAAEAEADFSRAIFAAGE